MAKFIKCSISETEYKGNVIVNDPVNIDMVSKVSKTVLRFYPDNLGAPSITFGNVDEQWVYDNEEDRDCDFYRIIRNETEY